MLLDHGAKINSTNKKWATPLIIAAVKGHYSVLRVLANHRQVKLHEQVYFNLKFVLVIDYCIPHYQHILWHSIVV